MKRKSEGRASPRHIEMLKEKGQRSHLLICHLELQKVQRGYISVYPQPSGHLKTGIWKW